MAEVRFREASRVFPGSPAVRAVDKLDLQVADGEFLVLVGPSGSGKSTALRMLAGLEDVDEGSIDIGGKDVTAVAPKDRDIAMVFQSYALYPHMTVAENMALALKLRKLPKQEITERVAEAARMLDLTPYLGRKPRALSGGQRQRVAMGRAIVREPAVFLMDEPLSNLDAKLRVETRANITALQTRLGTTTIYVTHDQVEAMTMGHRVAVLRDGLLQQCATPRELYDAPVNTFVAEFIGSPGMNLFTARVTADGASVDGLTVPLSRATRDAAGGLDEIRLGIRPEAFHLVGDDEPGLRVKVRLVEELGADAYVHGDVSLGGSAFGGTALGGTALGEGALGDSSAKVIVRTEGSSDAPAFGDTVRVGLLNPDRVHLFNSETGKRLPA